MDLRNAVLVLLKPDEGFVKNALPIASGDMFTSSTREV